MPARSASILCGGDGNGAWARHHLGLLDREHGSRPLPFLGIHDGNIARVGPMHRGVHEEADDPWNADRGDHRLAQRDGGIDVDALLLLLAECVVEGPFSKGGHDDGTDAVGDGVFKSTLPSEHAAPARRRHDVREDGEVRAGLRPGAQQAEDHHERQIDAEASCAWLDAAEHVVDDGDARRHCDLGAQRAPVQAEALREAVRDNPAHEVADGATNGLRPGDHRHLPLGNARELEEERHVAHHAPRHGAEDPLHDHHAKCRQPEEAQQAPELVQHDPEALAAGGFGMRRLLQEQGYHQRNHQREHADDDERDAPTLEAPNGLRGHGDDEEACHEHAHDQPGLQAAEHCPPPVLRRHVRNDPIGDWAQSGEKRAVDGATQDHEDEVGHEGERDDSEPLAHGCCQEDRPTAQDTPVGENSPKWGGEVRQH
mmetsp:Transcript_125877/g.364224  ORF Transcript_125877/g.364224 Transcript_125877/m.364224 type:complete len:427 (+) Transcript_125877:89-1369(+)